MVITKHFKVVLFLFFLLLPSLAQSNTDDLVVEKQRKVAMRIIGHEVLTCAGDPHSRVLPIEKTDQYYRISFENEFGFDPADIAATINDVIFEYKIAYRYLVEVQECETQEIAHSYVIQNVNYPNLIACKERLLPKDCYRLLITVLNEFYAPAPSNTSKSRSPIAFLAFPVFLLLILVGYSIKKRKTKSSTDLMQIGSYQFDRKNNTLLFEKHQMLLSNKESDLLYVLYLAANTPVERAILLQKVWGDEGDYIGRTLDVFISRLRKKFEASQSVKIVNIRGIGYKLVINQS